MVLVIVDLKSRVAYPISYVFLSSKKDVNHVPGYDRALELIASAMASGFPSLPVAADSWFDSKEFIAGVHHLGCEFAGELKSNRLAKANDKAGGLRQKILLWFAELKRHRLSQTRFQKRHEKRGKAYSQKSLHLTGLDLKLTVIAVYNRINGVKPFAIYATTDPSMAGARLWKLSRARWAIEVLFRDLKQSLGFGSLTAGGEGGAHMAVCIPIMLLTSIRLQASETWKSKKVKTLGTTVKQLREEALNNAIESIVHNPQSNLLSRMAARRKNPNQKPTNACGKKKVA